MATLATALALAAASCGGDDASTAERATVPTAAPTTTSEATTTTEEAPTFEVLVADPALTPEEQVEAAYLHSWDIYLDAVGRGDTQYLDLVYSGSLLETRRDEIDSLDAESHMVVGDVDHDYSVTVLTPTNAVVVDSYRNHLVLADATTDERLEADPDAVVVVRYDLVLEEGTWRVAFAERV